MKKYHLLFVFLLILGFLATKIVFAANGRGFLNGISEECYNAGQCKFCDVITVIFNILRFLRNDIAIPLAILMIIYGALVLIFAGGSPNQIQKGQKILRSAFIGILIIFGASLIINTVGILLVGENFTWSSFIGMKVQCPVPQF